MNGRDPIRKVELPIFNEWGITLENKFKIWDDFCRQHHVVEEGVPLFESTGDFLCSFPYGNDQRSVLKRSVEMEKLVTHRSFLTRALWVV